MVRVLAIVPTLGSDPARLMATLESVAAESTKRVRVEPLVVVNAPVWSPPPGIRALARVELVGMNLGWPGALRFGAGLEPAAPWLWLVQDDMVVRPGALAALLGALERDPGLAAVTPLGLDQDGRVGAGTVSGWFPPGASSAVPHPAEDLDPDQYFEPAAASFVASRGLLVRRSVWDEVGGMDPRLYPVQLADVDFCAALEAHGHRFAVEPHALVVHERSASTAPGFREFLLHRNLRLWLAKWRSEPDGQGPGPAHLTGVLHPDLDPALLALVAQSAGDALLDLGKRYSADARQAAYDRARLEAQLAALSGNEPG